MLVSPHHVLRGEERKVMVPRLAGFGIQFKRADTSVAAPGHIYANNKVQFRVEQLSVSYQTGPPFCRITVCGKGMKDPYNIGPVCIQMSMRGICKMNFGERNTTLQGKRVIVFINVCHNELSRKSRKGAKKRYFLLHALVTLRDDVLTIKLPLNCKVFKTSHVL
jgi:hypothetical protein